MRQGRVISLSLPIKGSTSSSVAQSVPHLKGRPLPQHFMSVDGADYEAGVKQPAGGRGIADDALIVSPHGTTTHMDALCHVYDDGTIYNGLPREGMKNFDGAEHCGIEKAGGFAARGVLNARPAIGQIDHHTQPAELCAAHRNHRHQPSPSTPKPKGTTVSSQSVRPVTSLSVIYTVCLRRLEKTLSVTVRDDTDARGRGGGRARSPAIAQSPNAAPVH